MFSKRYTIFAHQLMSQWVLIIAVIPSIIDKVRAAGNMSASSRAQCSLYTTTSNDGNCSNTGLDYKEPIDLYVIRSNPEWPDAELATVQEALVGFANFYWRKIHDDLPPRKFEFGQIIKVNSTVTSSESQSGIVITGKLDKLLVDFKRNIRDIIRRKSVESLVQPVMFHNNARSSLRCCLREWTLEGKLLILYRNKAGHIAPYLGNITRL